MLLLQHHEGAELIRPDLIEADPDAQLQRRPEIERTPLAPASSGGPLWAVVTKCLEVDRSLRYPSFMALRHDLDEIYSRVTGQRFNTLPPAPETAEDLLNRAFSLHLLGATEEAMSIYHPMHFGLTLRE